MLISDMQLLYARCLARRLLLGKQEDRIRLGQSKLRMEFLGVVE